MSPILSIVIPLYNKQDLILRTLRSVLAQKNDHYELVVVDDGSTDKSVQKVESLSDQRIRLFRKENGGPASARNIGVKNSQGKWILFLDADDTLEENALQIVFSDIKNHRFADVFCYCQYMLQNDVKRIFPEKHAKGYVVFPFLRWYLGQLYPGPGRMVVKRECMLQEPFREDLRRWEDGENVFRLMRRYRFYANPVPLFTYHRDSNEASRPCKDCKEDFICNLQPEGKSFFEQMAMYKLYQEARRLYSEDVARIYGNTFNKVKYWRAEKYLRLYQQHFEK